MFLPESCDFPYFRQMDHFSVCYWSWQFTTTVVLIFTPVFLGSLFSSKPLTITVIFVCFSEDSLPSFTIIICGCSLPIVFLFQKNLEEPCGVTGSSKTSTVVILFVGYCQARGPVVHRSDQISTGHSLPAMPNCRFHPTSEVMNRYKWFEYTCGFLTAVVYGEKCTW